MATKNCSTSADAQLQAAGYLLSEVASMLRIAFDLTHAAVQEPEPASHLLALAAMISQIGAMADRAGAACGHGRAQDPDDWLLSPRAAEQLRVLREIG
ncbi:MAG: hypothetical protein J0L57_11350 [Burkholderiales bacterium]|nr:hypothetical protein [Burkholderiales bacterium]